MKNVTLYSAVGLVVVATAGYFLISGSSGKDVKYRTEKVARGSVTLQVRATGSVNPVKTVEVGSQVSGTIARLFVDFNDRVKQGQVVAIIDSTFLYASVKEAQANLEHNQAQLNEAKRSFDRTSGLFSKNLVSQADLDAAETAYESALAQVKQAQASLDRAVVNLRYSVIRAPIDGVVISRDVDVGQTVAASLQAPKLFSIANDLTRMQVQASVDEADIGQVKEGLPVSFTVDAYPDVPFQGSVSQVRLNPVTVQNVVTYTVIVDVANPELKLRPGMTATISIMVARRDDVLRVPTLALRFQPPADVLTQARAVGDSSGNNDAVRPTPAGADSGWKGRGRREGGSQHMMNGARGQLTQVWILASGDKPRRVPVRLGLNDNRYVEVMGGGLKEGDDIIVGTVGVELSNATGSQSNPFQPRMVGGGGGGGRGR